MRKIIFSILLLHCCGLFAGTIGPVCTPYNVTVPCAYGAWALSAQALDLQTSYNKDYSYYPTGSNEIYRDQSGQWNWGFALAAAYYFNTGNDLTLDWYHLDTGTTPFAFDPLGEFGGVNVQLSLKNQWDAINAELAQSVNYGINKNIRFHGGLQFAHIKASINTLVTRMDFFGPVTNIAYSSYPTEFNGFGPRIGLDMNYGLDDGFSIYAKVASSLLTGTAKYAVKRINNGSELPSVLLLADSRTIIVPEIETRVGLSYNYAFSKGDLIFDVGYLWFQYFNPLSNQNALSNVLNTTALGTTDFGVSGPYLGLKYVS